MKEKIIELMETILNVPKGTITESTKMKDVEQWDSLAHVMLIGELENQLGIVIPMDEIIEIDSVEKLMEKAGVL